MQAALRHKSSEHHGTEGGGDEKHLSAKRGVGERRNNFKKLFLANPYAKSAS